MSKLSRRDLLVGSAAIVAAANIPVIPAMAKPAKIIPAWIVGTPGEFDWQLSFGRTAQEAIRNFVCEQVGGDGCEEGDDPDCECEWCYAINGAEAERKPMWDGKRESEITPGDWIRSGTGYLCSRCSYETFPEEGGHGVGAQAVCYDCMTLADWDVVDPEHAAELRGQSALSPAQDQAAHKESDGGVVADTRSNETATDLMAQPSPMVSRSCDVKITACGVVGVAPGPSDTHPAHAQAERQP